MKARFALIGSALMILSVVLTAAPALACHGETVVCEDKSWTDDDMSPDNINLEPSPKTVAPGETAKFNITMTLTPGCGSTYYLFSSMSVVPDGWKATYSTEPGGKGTDLRNIDNQQWGSGSVTVKAYLEMISSESAAEGSSATITAMIGADDNAQNDKDLVYCKCVAKIHIPHPKPRVANPLKAFSMPEDTVDTTHVDLASTFINDDGDPISFGVQTPTNFVVRVLSGGKTSIEPKKDWNGMETITFTCRDEYSLVTAAVDVTVTAVEDLPVLAMPIKDFFISKDGEDTTTVNLNKVFVDADTPYGDVLTFSATGWKNISVSIKADGKVYFKPLTGWAGNETIAFSASDKAGNKASDEAKVTVTDTRRPPYIKNHLADRSFPEDTVDTSIDLSQVFASPDLNTVLTYDTMGCCFINITITSGGKVTLSPYKDSYGNVEITFSATDGMFSPIFDVCKVTVTPVNDQPYQKKPLNISMAEDTVSASVFLDSYFGDVDGTKLVYNMASSDTLTPTIYPKTSEMTISPGLNYNGEQSLKLTASDGELDITVLVPVVVTPVDDPPILITWLPGGNTICTEGDKVAFSIEAMDIDGEVLGYTWEVDQNFTPFKGKYEGKAAIEFKATAALACAPGTHTVTVWVDGGQKSSTSHGWQLTVRPGNRAPSVPVIRTPLAGQNFTTKMDINFDASADDPDMDTLTYKWTIDGTEASSLKSFTTKLAEGVHTVKVTASDPKGASATSDAMNVTVTRPVTKPGNNQQPGFEGLVLVAALGAAVVLLRKRK